LPERQRTQARSLSAEIDGLLAGEGTLLNMDGHVGRLSEELAVASRLNELVASFPPVPADLERRVQEIVRSRPVYINRSWRPAHAAALSALATALVFLIVFLAVPGMSVGRRSWAQVIDVLLGQTRVTLTPTLQVGSTLAASLTPEASAPPVREPLRDLVAAELLIGRAPSLPKALPQGYVLQEIVAVSYPDLPSWISQPFYVELCYGREAEGSRSDLRLRQYRLLFREFGGISGVQVASGAVKDIEQVDVKGATGMLLTLDSPDRAFRPAYTVLWERDGLLLELETDGLSQENLLDIARSVR
jgi:hypothetical protein